MLNRAIHIIRKRFTAKLVVFFTLVFFLTGTILAVFFVQYQKRACFENLIANGSLISEILAYNSRLGVFSENSDLLDDVVKGVLKQENVLQVSVFNNDGELIIENAAFSDKPDEKPIHLKKIPDKEILVTQRVVIIESDDYFEFWSPVKSSSAYLAKEAFFIDNEASPDFADIIGYTGIIIDKLQLKRQALSLVYKGIMLAVLFWLAGTTAIFLIVRNVTGPLKSLTSLVDQMGEQGVIMEIPVETEDEVGNLARAFNNMSASLKQKKNEKDELESRLHQSQKMEAIGTLASGIAHDFNNIIGAIVGFSELALLQIKDSPELEEKLSEILNAGNRATQLVEQILTFSRQTDQSRTPLHTVSIVKEVLKLLRPSIPSSITIDEDIDPDCGLILSHPTSIHQIMMNLCTNAVHAIKNQKGIIKVSLCDMDLNLDFANKIGGIGPGRYQRLSISDSGSGIAPDIMKRIFDPFFTTKEIGVGTGMGLSVVHGIVKNNKGGIRVISSPDKGTCFEVYFPLMAPGAVNEATVEETSPPTGDERVLVVDDEKPLVKLYREYLEGLGYCVRATEDSTTALSIFKNRPDSFDLVITDMTMPEMSGLDLAEKILKVRADIPIILCTGFSEMVDKNKAQMVGIKALLMKPVSRQKLAKIVRLVLDQSDESL